MTIREAFEIISGEVPATVEEFDEAYAELEVW